MQAVRLGVIGGSGVYQIDGIQLIKEHRVQTPFGQPSDAVIEASIDDRRIFFLPRHGRGHRFTPSEVNYRANIYAMKQFGVTHLLAVSAVGIMREDIRPGDMIIPDQLFDRTKGQRASSFFGDGIVGHVQFADPFSAEMRAVIRSSIAQHTTRFHDGGTLVVMEGPQFSTRAESHFYRKTLSPVAIGMTALPEAKLAREAELCYGMMAMATDYDCWHESEEDVSVEAVMAVLKANSSLASKVVKTIATSLPTHSNDPCLSAAKYAVMTQADLIPAATRAKLNLLYGKYLNEPS
jgi:5'-methylthioadenosine phosphorylase